MIGWHRGRIIAPDFRECQTRRPWQIRGDRERFQDWKPEATLGASLPAAWCGFSVRPGHAWRASDAAVTLRRDVRAVRTAIPPVEAVRRMRTCPACGRQFPADVEFCEADGEPLSPMTVATVSPEGAAAEPETIVRPRRAQPIPSDPGIEAPRFTKVRVDIPESKRTSGQLNVPEPIVVPTGTPDRVYRERALWPIFTALGVVVVVASALFIYVWMSQQSDFEAEVSTQISQARVTVADAKARLESLSADSPLRGKLLQLQNWDRELQDLELGRDRTREMAQRAREIGDAARRVGEEARAAGAMLPAAPPPVAPAAPSNSNASLPDSPASPTMDPASPTAAPAAPASSGTGTDPAKPPEGGTAPGQPPPVKPPAPKQADPSAPAKTDDAAQPKPDKSAASKPPA